MHVLITGATGLVGTKLSINLLKQGHTLTVIGRSSEEQFRSKYSLPCSYLSWKDLNKSSDLKRIDAVIHLAGESIATGRWTRKKKERIYNSRVESTRKLARYLIQSGNIPEVFISASGVGYYGETWEPTQEDGRQGEGYLSEVCEAWEGASKILREKCRLVHLRLGVVLDNDGGFLGELEPLFRKGAGGVIGHGKQYLSWVHIQDVLSAMNFILDNESCVGAVNLCSPQPITNKEWTRQFSKILKIPALFFVPKVGLRLLLGEKSQLALMSQNVVPNKLEKLGFEFQYANITLALEDLYSWKKKRTDRVKNATQWVAKDVNETFSFFSEAKNLEKITPPLLNFKILNMSTSEIKYGTVINYRLKIHGVPAGWKTLIKQWDPPHSFVDNQESGPYSLWHHTHSFEPLSGGTLMSDQVIYRLPMGLLGDFFGSWLVISDINKIFSFRKESLSRHL